ncbi:hypothetical protein ABIB60_002985 [Hymenobacter sp. UYP22]
MPELEYRSFSGNLTEPYLLVMPLELAVIRDSLAREHYPQEKRRNYGRCFCTNGLSSIH